jgi:hypothetical protein
MLNKEELRKKAEQVNNNNIQKAILAIEVALKNAADRGDFSVEHTVSNAIKMKVIDHFRAAEWDVVEVSDCNKNWRDNFFSKDTARIRISFAANK